MPRTQSPFLRTPLYWSLFAFHLAALAGVVCDQWSAVFPAVTPACVTLVLSVVAIIYAQTTLLALVYVGYLCGVGGLTVDLPLLVAINVVFVCVINERHVGSSSFLKIMGTFLCIGEFLGKYHPGLVLTYYHLRVLIAYAPVLITASQASIPDSIPPAVAAGFILLITQFTRVQMSLPVHVALWIIFEIVHRLFL